MPRHVVVLLLAVSPFLNACTPRSSPGGVSIESLEAGGAAARAGLRTGDVLQTWRSTRAEGRFASPLDVFAVEMEQAPFGEVAVAGERAGTPFAAPIPAGEWRLATRPLPPRTPRGASSRDATWRLVERAGSLAAQGDVAAAHQAYDEARDTARRAGDRALEAYVSAAEAERATARSDLAAAGAALAAAAAVEEALDPRGLRTAGLLLAQSRAAFDRGDLGASRALAERALAIRRAAAPGSVEVASTLNQLGRVAWASGDLEAAEARYREGIPITDRVAPESLEAVRLLSNLGLVVRDRGDLRGADALFARAHAIAARAAPDSLVLPGVELNLAAVASDRGDYARAETLLAAAVAVYARRAPGSVAHATALHNLGVEARNRGDYVRAEDLYREALGIAEKRSPDSLEVAASLNTLGSVLWLEEKRADAEVLYRRALAIRERLAPGGVEHAETLRNLGSLAREMGRLGEAEPPLAQALAIAEKRAPRGVNTSIILDELARVALDRGDLPRARALLMRALAIQRRVAPATDIVAKSLRDLARVERQEGRPDAALASLAAAVDAVEEHESRLGATDEGSRLEQPDAYYRELVEALAERGRAGEALRALERSRARGLRRMLAARDLTFPGEIPEPLARRRREVDAEYEATQERLAELLPGRDDDAIERLLATLRATADARRAVVQQIGAASPRLASLQYAPALDLAGVRAALDPGTVLLSYSVGPSRTLLFVVAADIPGVEMHTIAVGEDAIRARVRLLRGLIEMGRDDASTPPDLLQQAAWMYDTLVRPAETRVSGAARLLIVPDGPLQQLPYGALRRTSSSGGWLAAWKPIHTVNSVTVYAELRARRAAARARAGTVFSGFADPWFPPRAPLVRAHGLLPLPASRDEVRRIAALFPGGAEVRVGASATEEAAKSLGAGPRYVHFASHAILDSRFPLDSALALAIPVRPREGEDNGLLQAWEVIESVRIDADLVTLSACDTGLGAERGGEGLVGLSRAFQYAGARTVMASLWPVSDASTSDLMIAFYRHLADGATKDDALQAAERESIAAGRNPFRWAAFQLIGDWR